jgi:GTPase
MKPVVALIGRPNVGKSTLFNRITRRRDALVDNMPGVTRDRHCGDAAWDDHEFVLVDTGGYISGDADNFAAQIRFQVEQAIAEADAVVVVLDGKSGVSPFDRDLIHWMRTVQHPVFYVVNKIDGPENEILLHDFYILGIDTIYSLSAEHGYGMADFLDALTAALPESESGEPEDIIRVALLGRPNVGKSSLVNRLVGQHRQVVSAEPGTTRDAIDTIFKHDRRKYSLIDTAGIRRKAKVDRKLEKFSIIKALKSLERCDVALIVLDAAQGITEQDITVAGHVHERGCGSIFVINKWDLVDKGETPKKFEQRLREMAKHQGYAPVLSVSAMTGLRVKKIFEQINHVYDQYVTRIGTGPINRIIQEATTKNEPPMHKGRRLKFYYTTQISTRPPTFVSFVNYPDAIHFSYQRYLLNQLRSATGLEHVPLRLFFRLRSGKIDYSKKGSRP